MKTTEEVSPSVASTTPVSSRIAAVSFFAYSALFAAWVVLRLAL